MCDFSGTFQGIFNFSRTFQESHLNSSIFQVCAKPGVYIHQIMVNVLEQPVHCYVINDRSYMTEKMSIVMLSTNTARRERIFMLD